MKTTKTIIDVTTDRSVCTGAGTLLLADTATALSVTDTLDAALAGLTPATVTHSAGSVLSSLAVALSSGATCLDDLNLLTPLAATGLVTPLPSTATAHRRIHQLADSIDRVDDRMPRAMRTLRTRAWAALGDMNPATSATRDNPLILDIDASLIHIHSDKQSAAATYKKGFGFHPLCAFVDHGPGVGGEPLAVLMRPGDAGANNADDHIELIRTAYRALPGSQNGGHIGGKILVRTDGAGGTRKFANHLYSRGFAYSLGIRVNEHIGRLVSTLPQDVKQGVLRPDAAGGVTDTDAAYVTDITGLLESGKTGEYGIRLDAFPPGTRVIVRVEYPSAGCQLRITDIDGRRVTAFITDSSGQPQVLDLRHRGRGRCEQRIKDTKDLGFLAVPHHSYAANRIWTHAVVLAGAMSTWARLLGAEPAELAAAKTTACDMRRNGYSTTSEQAREKRKAARSWWWLWGPGSLRARVLSTAATVARHARQVRVHLDGNAAHAGLLEAALSRIRSLSIPI
ncbi:IS1380 family transposase [Corynebacterium sp. AOP12-C2-36]|uniref:IS1380 family transposase n=1 Tax=Corynebacterium sp. AOP12-C2-36 TaxID=3457723 RepID=UPI0040343087